MITPNATPSPSRASSDSTGGVSMITKSCWSSRAASASWRRYLGWFTALDRRAQAKAPPTALLDLAVGH